MKRLTVTAKILLSSGFLSRVHTLYCSCEVQGVSGSSVCEQLKALFLAAQEKSRCGALFLRSVRAFADASSCKMHPD